MSTSNKGTAFIDEFREFITFLQSLWGILAGISILFPLSNSLMQVIPLAQKIDTPTYEFINSNQVTTFTTLIALFIIIWTFGRRHEFKTQRKYNLIRKQAMLSFCAGFLALILYYFLFYGIYGIFYEPFNITSGEPLRILGDVSLMLFYSGFFVLITRAFMLLGMIEFYR